MPPHALVLDTAKRLRKLREDVAACAREQDLDERLLTACVTQRLLAQPRDLDALLAPAPSEPSAAPERRVRPQPSRASGPRKLPPLSPRAEHALVAVAVLERENARGATTGNVVRLVARVTGTMGAGKKHSAAAALQCFESLRLRGFVKVTKDPWRAHLTPQGEVHVLQDRALFERFRAASITTAPVQEREAA